MSNEIVAKDAALPAPSARMEVFSFGDPESVLDARDIVMYLQSTLVGKWYDPPISFDGLAKSYRASVHHASAIQVKRNIIAGCYKPHPMLSRTAFTRWVQDFLIFGNAYLEKVLSRSGKIIELKPALARYVRRGADLESYWFWPNWIEEFEFAPGSVFHLMEPDINQEIYGLPDYIPALHSAWLAESATLFRRKYYLNGSHAGFILYLTDTAHQQADIDDLRQALKKAKGPGNFRNLFMYAPGGKKDGIQIIPVAEVAAKDEFLHIKTVTRDDQLAAHRVPPQLLGIVPSNTGGFGDAEKAAGIFAANEIDPIQNRLLELNDWVGEEVVSFTEYRLATPPAAAPAA